MIKTGLISEIDPLKNLDDDKWYLTFDIDWAHDEILRYLIDILESYQVKATFFVTHQTDLLIRIKKSKLFELGIHPNFNFLLSGDFRYGRTAEEVLIKYLDIVPDAKSVRSHSLTQYSPMFELYAKFGLTHESNQLIPWHSGMKNKAYFDHIANVVRVPICWEDDVHAMYGHDWSLRPLLKFEGLRVLDFHPIHIFLNMDDIERYYANKRFSEDPKMLLKNKNKGRGSESFLLEILNYLK